MLDKSSSSASIGGPSGPYQHQQKISHKEAKEMYEMCAKLEVEYKSVISAVVPAIVNMAYISTQVKAHVDSEQSKTLWVPVSSASPDSPF